ncbi:hypothetical protein AU196_03840 [Mycobacterium sp. IS-1742]|uniref:hypothetical protein n=1 Tax=Mycobacterium sp. IS-1742 TaxID=1772285 RepID=UPI0007404C85|nr:hypothetical protein [Mycobacterium sp. IS-1742]KUI29473.1 hypothetical protein AU196_03840 [Mycobacterium sp. IS-1742]
MGRRNPIQVVGEPIRQGVTWISDDLIRSGAHDDALGSDGLVVMVFMLSWAITPGSARRPWETSAAQISEQFGWGLNRERAKRALDRAVKDRRLIIREYIRDGQVVPRRCAYVVCAGGRRFTDEELLRHSAPVSLPPKARPV